MNKPQYSPFKSSSKSVRIFSSTPLDKPVKQQNINSKHVTLIHFVMACRLLIVQKFYISTV